jgi:hypothetical protein
LKHGFTIWCDALQLVPRVLLTDDAGERSPIKQLELDTALRVALE